MPTTGHLEDYIDSLPEEMAPDITNDMLLLRKDSDGSMEKVSPAVLAGTSFPEFCSVYGDAVSQADGAEAAVACAHENYDPSGMHDNVTNNSRITIANTGYYHIDGHILYANNSTGMRAIEIRKNGTSIVGIFHNASTAPFGTVMSASIDLYLTAGQYVELYAYQNSTGALNATVICFNIHRFG